MKNQVKFAVDNVKELLLKRKEIKKVIKEMHIKQQRAEEQIAYMACPYKKGDIIFSNGERYRVNFPRYYDCKPWYVLVCSKILKNGLPSRAMYKNIYLDKIDEN